MSQTLSSHQVARRRRAAAWKRSWREFRRHPPGGPGLVLLVIFVATALLAPVLADPSGLEVTKATGGVLEPPSAQYWLGTDDNGRSILTLLIWGPRSRRGGGCAPTSI